MFNGGQTKKKKIILKNDLAGLQAISLLLDELSETWHIPASLAMTINLVLEEAFTNVINHAYKDAEVHDIEITLEIISNLLKITLKDDGEQYDPTLAASPDISKPAEEREIGGLGILLIKKMMDKVTYQRQGIFNVLQMEKIIQTKK
jgi:serine/threonine-protein kinase RsbW